MNLYSLLCIIPDYIPDENINIILNDASKDFSLATTGHGEEEKTSDYRMTKWLSISNNLRENLFYSIYHTHELELKQKYQSNCVYIEPPQLLRYDVGDHYDKHNDSESYVDGKLKRVCERDIAIIYYLNDNYEGGELEFTQLQILIKPKKGMFIAFPAYEEFEHKVHPVRYGTRFNIVSWITTEKRIYDRPYDTATTIS